MRGILIASALATGGSVESITINLETSGLTLTRGMSTANYIQPLLLSVLQV